MRDKPKSFLLLLTKNVRVCVCSSAIRESLFDNFVLFRLYRLTERGNEKCYCYRCHSLCRFIIPTVLLLFSLPSSPADSMRAQADSTEKPNHQNWTHKMHKRWWWWHRYYCNIMLNVCANDTQLMQNAVVHHQCQTRAASLQCTRNPLSVSCSCVHWERASQTQILNIAFVLIHTKWIFSVSTSTAAKQTEEHDTMRSNKKMQLYTQTSSAQSQTAVKCKRRSSAHWIIFKWQTECIYKRLHTCQWFIQRMRPV